MRTFLPTSHKSAIKNNPRMQLQSIFYKKVERNKVKGKFQSHELVVFQELRKL